MSVLKLIKKFLSKYDPDFMLHFKYLIHLIKNTRNDLWQHSKILIKLFFYLSIKIYLFITKCNKSIRVCHSIKCIILEDII